MFTTIELAALYRSLGDELVLSVYVDGSITNPADQRAWHVQLHRQLADVRRSLTSADSATRQSFDDCVGQLDTATSRLTAGVGAPGWVAFVTADRIHAAHQLPVSVPTRATWGLGPRIAPYIRSLKEDRAVVVVVADARRAVLYRYHLMELSRAGAVRSHHSIDHPEHMGTPVRRGFHSPTRGTAGHDAAQQALLEGRDRMIDHVSQRALDLAKSDGWILVGGIARVAARLAEQLEASAPHRILEVSALDVHAAPAEVKAFARSGASELRAMADERRLSAIIEAAGAHGLAVAGADGVSEALVQLAVRDLYLTARYLDGHADAAEQAARAAINQDASVEVVAGRAAALLDEQGGVAAGLRFRTAGVNGLARR
jgi:hypothetical protein